MKIAAAFVSLWGIAAVPAVQAQDTGDWINLNGGGKVADHAHPH